MNRIKHFMILALALAMSLGAWAQQEVLLTTVTATGETSYSQSPDGIVTVTLNIGFYDDYDYGWLGGTVTVEANQGYTITRCVFKQNTVSIADDLAPFTATLSGYSTDNVSVETSNGHVNGDADHMIGITSIEVYGHQADPSPTVTHNTDGSWGFTMPDYDAALNVTYYLQPNLAWTYNSAAMPAEGLTAYRGFVLPVIGGIGASMDHDFLTALEGGTVSLRYGSVNGVVTFTDPNDRQSFTVTGSGLDTVYMVFDGNDDYQYDSVSFPVKIADPDTLTLSANGNGTVSPLLGGDDVWYYETWANLSTTGSEHSFTVGDITLSHTGNEYEGFYQLTTSGNPLRILSSSGTLTFTSNGAPFTRIQLLMVDEYSSGNPKIQPLDGWSFDGRYATWEGNAQSVSMTQCTTKVDQITFTRGSNSIVATATEGQYLVIPGAEVQVVATAKDGNHVSAWSDNRQPQHYTSDTNTITVGESQTLTATFAQNPLLTLASNNGGTVTLDGDSIGTVYTFTFEHSGNSEDDRAITIPANRLPYDTTFSYNANIEFADAYDQAGESVSKIAHGAHTVTVRISGPFEYGGYYQCELEGGDRDDWTISCTTGTGPVTPNGITKTGDNTYRVLPGTQLSVTATPDPAHYLSRIDGHDTVSNYACGYSFVMPDNDHPLMADFTTKPTLTLAQTDGGTLEAIVPQGGATAMHLTTDQIPTWSGNTEYAMEADLQPFGFVAVDSAAAAAWTGAPASGYITLVYALAGNQFKTIIFQDGQWYAAITFDFYKADFYTSPDVFYFTTGATAANVIASSTPNTYYIDYGTPVTVKATPDAQHYLVSFSDDDPATERNSNVAVEKTYDSVIADIPLSANFQAKPTLTLTANAGGTLTLDGITTELDQMMAHLSDPIAPGTKFSAFLQSDGVLKDNVKTLTDAQAIALAQRIAQTTGNNNILVVASTFEFIGDKYLSYGKPDGNIEGGTATMTNSNAIRTIYYVNTFDLLPETYPAGVTAGTTANTYRVDYGTTLTVTATPDATHYLATLGGVTMGSNTAKDTTFRMTATTNLEANFELKPTLTLAHNDGGEMEIVPAGGATAIVPPTDQIALWEGNYAGNLAENDIPATLGFVAVDQAAAAAWTGAPTSGNAMLIYDIDGEYFHYLSFNNGSLTGNDEGTSTPGGFYQMASAGTLYITTGVTPSNVTASTEPNTYYIDYNTSVTVKATPSDTAYLVRFDQDADTNSNTAVEKTYGPLTAALTTAEATFNDKPVLTLAQNEADWGTMGLAGEGEGEGEAAAWVLTAYDQLQTGDTVVIVDRSSASALPNNASGSAPSAVSVTLKNNILTSEPDATLKWVVVRTNSRYQFQLPGSSDIFLNCSTVNNSVRASSYFANEFILAEGGEDTLYLQNTSNSRYVGVYNNQDWRCYIDYNVNIRNTFLGFYKLGTASSGLPAGVAQLTDSTYRVDYGTTLTVQADATELHHVKNWVDADSAAYPADSITYSDYAITTPQNLFPAKSAVTLTVTGDTMTKAIFGINSYDVFARVDTTEDVRGTVRAEYIDIDGVSQSVAADDTVTYTAQGGNLSLVIAIPTEPGYHFERWTDTLGTELGTNDTLEVTEAAAVIAVFDTNVYQISGTVAEGSEEWGEVTGSGDYRHFTQATLEAQPIEHYHFVRWEDGNTENPRVIDVVGPESHQAEFAIDRFIVSWSSNDEAMGHVVGPYDNHTTGAPIPRLRGVWGTTFQLVAQPAEHHMLDHWSTGATTNGITVTITENAEIVAYFKHVPYIVTVLSEDETMGTVAGTDTLEWQESTEISATANYGYHFTMWNDGVTDNPRTVVNNIESDQTFTASFAKNEYTVTVVSADETMGSVAGTDTVEYLDEIEISATANEHYHFVQWNDGETANPRTVSVTKNETYTATFAPNVYTLTLGINNAIMGTVALTAPAVTPNADGSYSIAYGTAVTVKGSASSRCFELGSWSDGAVVTADGSHSFSMAGNLVLTATFVNHLFRSDTVADVCDRFVWHGIAYTETPDVAPLHRLTTVDGCDSALVLNLTVRHSSTGVDEQVHCTPYTWIDGVTYSESNHTAQYILPGANAEQCDSIVTLDLTIGTQAESTEVVNACDSYEWHGVVYTETPAEAPTYTYHTLEGCDSTVTLQLTIGHPTEGIETIVACAPIEWHGTVYSESTDEPTWHTTNAAGCDSTVTLHLTIAPAIETEETVEACDEYEWHGVVYTETPAEAPTYTTVSVQGCDSTVTLHLTVNHSTAAVETVVACNSYEWHGVSYASSTTVPTYTTTGSNGCDSTTTLHLTINRSTSAVETVEACDSYEWHGTTYTVSTSLPTYTTEGSNGCDSTTTLNLTIKQSSRATETVVTCDEYEWHGVLFTETPVEAPTYTTEGSNGCDSTVTLNLTVNHSADVVETIGACAAIEWHGTVYSESTTEPTWHSTTVAGCDSTVTLHLTISDRIETEETVVACDSYEWHGVVYTASTDNATWSTTSIQGCDSTVTLHLTINRSTTGSETIEACESYEWHGVTYRQSGSYTFDTLNVAGCDSTVTLTLTLHQPTSGSEFVTTCGSYVWHEVTYTQSGAYVWHGTDVHGCDSTVTLLLTILQPVYSTENRTACNSYTWHGTEYSESGDYTWSTTAVSGCDSIVTLHLTINLPVTSDVEESACERYSWNGIVYSTSGDYVQTFTGVNGCDSTVTLHLTVNMPATETLGVTACDSYEWHEVTYTESGVYSWHGTTVAGCDSTATLNLTIGHSADTTISLQGEGSIVWNGETFTQSGTYERVIRTVLGCDSTVTLNLVILPEGFVMPYLYNIMDVVLTINHFQQGETNLQYHWYRWYRNGKMVAEGRAMDTYSEGGSKLNGVYYLEVAIDESLEYWVRSNEVTIGTVGIDEAEDIDFTVAPNPVMHGSTVSVAVEGADVQGAVISVYDVQGREVLRQQNSAFIEAPAASGMYMVRLTLNDGRTAVKRLIVK